MEEYDEDEYEVQVAGETVEEPFDGLGEPYVQLKGDGFYCPACGKQLLEGKTGDDGFFALTEKVVHLNLEFGPHFPPDSDYEEGVVVASVEEQQRVIEEEICHALDDLCDFVIVPRPVWEKGGDDG